MSTLDAVATDLREQWELMRAWLDELPDPASSAPSTLPGWSLGVLVAHLGRNLSATAAATIVEVGEVDEPSTVSEYLAHYREVDPDHIDRNARDYAVEIAADPLVSLDELAASALDHVDALVELGGEHAVVRNRHGEQIGLTDFLLTRLLEMVVHGYDLAPTLPLPAPVDPTARTLVAEALLDVLAARTGYRLDVVEQEAWIKAATGRIDWPTAVERGAVRPSAISDGTPDLAPSLPLL